MNRLRDLREDKDMYQKDIAKILDMSQTGYSQYETKANDIPTEILKKLAKFYNTSIDYLLDRTDDVVPYPRKKQWFVNIAPQDIPYKLADKLTSLEKEVADRKVWRRIDFFTIPQSFCYAKIQLPLHKGA